jgi:hypothetical protein
LRRVLSRFFYGKKWSGMEQAVFLITFKIFAGTAVFDFTLAVAHQAAFGN